MTINDFIKRTRKINIFGHEEVRPRVICSDGYSVSIQVGTFAYCTPRENAADHYDTVELGYPSSEDLTIKDYAEDPEYLTDTVYPYVPVKLVDNLIKKHGGIINFNK